LPFGVIERLRERLTWLDEQDTPLIIEWKAIHGLLLQAEMFASVPRGGRLSILKKETIMQQVEHLIPPDAVWRKNRRVDGRG
jgi:hypothetical protein